MKAIVLTFDRLPAHLLGCYGNEWMETPGFDRLASLGSVFDHHFAEVPGPVGPDHSWWTGQFEYFASSSRDSAQRDGDNSNWLKQLAGQGVKCRLLAENTEGLPTDLFYSSEAVGGVTGLNARHDDVPIARLVQRGIEILHNGGTDSPSSDRADDSTPELLWLHSTGVPSPWLPPRLFAELYLDELEEIVDGESCSEIASDLVGQFENDPDLVRLLLSEWRREANDASDDIDVSEPEELARRSDSDPDDIESPELERQISRLVFAGYVSMIDRWVLKLLEAVENSEEHILVVVSSNQGHSFGETLDLVPATGRALTQDVLDHGRESGGVQPELLSDAEVRTPLLLAEFSGSSNENVFGSRHSALVQPVDLAATLKNWFGFMSDESGGSDEVGQDLLTALAGDTPRGHSHAYSLAIDRRLGIRSRNWSLVTTTDALKEEDLIHSEVQLFVRPDDQWDVHNVASQYREEVDALLNLLRERLSGRQ